jgi:DNA-binding HxlR family transcriptional regulator
LHFASDPFTIPEVPRKRTSGRRSGCPVSIALDLIGDRWSLLVIRDLMVRGYRTFREFQQSGEGIATNILADRLQRLEAEKIIAAEADEQDARKVNYRLTRKGIELAPVLLELLVWSAQHEKTSAPPEMVAHVVENRGAFLAEVRRRWEANDPTPLIPPFPKQESQKRRRNT